MVQSHIYQPLYYRARVYNGSCTRQSMLHRHVYHAERYHIHSSQGGSRTHTVYVLSVLPPAVGLPNHMNSLESMLRTEASVGIEPILCLFTGQVPNHQANRPKVECGGVKPLILLCKSSSSYRLVITPQKVSERGFEPPTSWSQATRSSQTELHTDKSDSDGNRTRRMKVDSFPPPPGGLRTVKRGAFAPSEQ